MTWPFRWRVKSRQRASSWEHRRAPSMKPKQHAALIIGGWVPWRASGTKPDAGLALGAEGFQRLVALAKGIPCVAIAG
jgi:hypothetical protein